MVLTPELIDHISRVDLPGQDAQYLMAPMGRPRHPASAIPTTAKQAAILVALYEEESVWKTVLMQRVAHELDRHSGQVSWPGGKQESDDADLSATALREFEEEMGVSRDQLTILRKLTDIYIPVSGFHVHPYIAVADGSVEITPEQAEVDHVIEIPLADLLRLERRRTEVQIPHGGTMMAPAYVYQETIIWGATSMILSELQVLLRGINL